MVYNYINKPQTEHQEWEIVLWFRRAPSVVGQHLEEYKVSSGTHAKYFGNRKDRNLEILQQRKLLQQQYDGAWIEAKVNSVTCH